MRLLLDTYCWLWAVADPDRLGDARLLVADRASDVFLSTASAWELAIKYRLGKLPLPEPPELFVPPRLLRDRIQPLPVLLAHSLLAGSLPPHHRDPFDRMLVAQAQLEGLTLVTANRSLAAYGAPLILTG